MVGICVHSGFKELEEISLDVNNTSVYTRGCYSPVRGNLQRAVTNRETNTDRRHDY